MDDPDAVWLFIGTSLVSACLLLFCCGSFLCLTMLNNAGVLPILCCIRGCSSEQSMWTELYNSDDLNAFSPTVGDKDENLFAYSPL